MSEPKPLLSVILVTPDSYRRVRKTIQCLRRQTSLDRLEVVIATPTAELLDASSEDWEGFCNVKVVATGRFRNTGHPRAAAVSHAAADVIAFGEDHCFPQDGWVESLAGLHQLPWAAMSPSLENANPGAVSWADFLLNFGPAVAPTDARPASYTPWHNTAYRRSHLLSYGDRLEYMLEAEIRLQQDLLEQGHQLYLAADTRASHINISRWQSFLSGQFLGGRIYGAARAESFHWTPWKRAIYVLAAPLIPFVRFRRVINDGRRTNPSGNNGRFLLACACGLAASSLGEAAGYLLGAGSTGRDRITFEFERNRHVRATDLALLEPESTSVR